MAVTTTEAPKQITFEDDIIALLRDEPFWGHIVVSLRRQADTSLNTTAAVGLQKSGITLYYNPERYFEMKGPQRRADIVHEALHVALRHFARRQDILDDQSIFSIIDADVAAMVKKMHPACLMKIFNYAADIAINPGIRNISENRLFPKTFDLPPDLSLEEYFVLLLKQLQNQQDGAGQGQGPQGGADEGKEKKQGQDSNEEPAGNGHVCPGCGGGALKVPFQGDHSRWTGEGDVTESDVRAAEAFVTGLLKDCHGRGLMPAELESLFQDVIKPKVNIQSILRQFTASCKSESMTRSWMVLNRRLPFRLKGKKREDSLTLVVAIDSSGSITEKFLQLFAGFLMAFHREGVRIIVIVCDAAIHETYEFKGRISKFKGRGGTAFQPVLDYIDEHHIDADGVIFLTDGDGDNPPLYRRAKVLWLVTPSGRTPAQWGKVVFLPKDVM